MSQGYISKNRKAFLMSTRTYWSSSLVVLSSVDYICSLNHASSWQRQRGRGRGRGREGSMMSEMQNHGLSFWATMNVKWGLRLKFKTLLNNLKARMLLYNIFSSSRSCPYTVFCLGEGKSTPNAYTLACMIFPLTSKLELQTLSIHLFF